MKFLWMDIYILIVLGGEERSTSGIKEATEIVKQTAQNTKLTRVDFSKRMHPKKKHESSKMPLLSN